ncbi:hypothetical protein ACFOGI_08970 [Virgibacillus xinjiangensis]|uniref:SpoVT-AbrB domain-containing protein n=1 Tax=Virgibacillus xinjiangensis TaxID=393090 RepID=A0ABV7CVP3_9BACI
MEYHGFAPLWKGKQVGNRFQLTCRLTTKNTVTIPKTIREILGLKLQEEVAISYSSHSGKLYIQKLNRDNATDNRMIIDSRGGIRIPIEIQRFLRLKKGDEFSLYIINSEKIMLKKQ